MSETQTVLLTGSTGYIAKHITVKLLNAGYRVVGSVRSLSRGEEVVNAVTPHLTDISDLDRRLRFVALDLAKDDGWQQAMEGVDILMHTASPFPMNQPKDEDELIRPAVDGALRALRAANATGVRRVVMTSSAVAIMEGELPPGRSIFDEDDWSDLEHPGVTPYAKSKTLAERAAWDFIRDEAPEIDLTTINPTLVIGPPLDLNFGTSVSLVERLLRAKDPMLPRFGFPFVDVRDVAEMHLRALTTPAATGKRFLAAESSLWFAEAAKILKEKFPNRKIVTREAPNILVRVMALFDKSVGQILPALGKKKEVSNNRAESLLKMNFIPTRNSLEETAEFLIQNEVVR